MNTPNAHCAHIRIYKCPAIEFKYFSKIKRIWNLARREKNQQLQRTIKNKRKEKRKKQRNVKAFQSDAGVEKKSWLLELNRASQNKNENQRAADKR